MADFNSEQLATYEEARELAAKLSAGPIVVGGGVKPENAESTLSGIYRPEWNTFGGPEPSGINAKGEKTYFLHFRFNNGAEGMNVGLIREKFGKYPSSPLYVLGTFAAEAAGMATV